MLNLQSQINNLPQFPGVYLFKDKKGDIIYIGKAKNLQKRVKSYFQKTDLLPKTQLMLTHLNTFDITRVNSEFEALLLEAELIKKYRPKYNVIWKDDKHYIYIRLTREEFPKVLYSRREDNLKDQFFGPYPSAGTLKHIMGLLRHIFPFCTQKRNLSRACFYSHIGLCNPCPSAVVKLPYPEYQKQKKQYRGSINLLKMILQGKLRLVKEKLRKEMNAHVEQEEYEEAGQIKDRIQKLEVLFSSYQLPQDYIKNPDSIIQIRINEQKDLMAKLGNYFAQLNIPKTIECYDISNISGRFAAGSLVTFIDGEPAKDFYRHFRIKFKSTPDDFFMLREVFIRRLKHEEWDLPDLFVVDGGIPQVATMTQILNNQKITIPLVGLAKKEEQIIIPHQGKFVTLSLPIGSPALSLIQRLRDEAHRFAHRYHEFLRLKYLLGKL